MPVIRTIRRPDAGGGLPSPPSRQPASRWSRPRPRPPRPQVPAAQALPATGPPWRRRALTTASTTTGRPREQRRGRPSGSLARTPHTRHRQWRKSGSGQSSQSSGRATACGSYWAALGSTTWHRQRVAGPDTTTSAPDVALVCPSSVIVAEGPGGTLDYYWQQEGKTTWIRRYSPARVRHTQRRQWPGSATFALAQRGRYRGSWANGG